MEPSISDYQFFTANQEIFSKCLHKHFNNEQIHRLIGGLLYHYLEVKTNILADRIKDNCVKECLQTENTALKVEKTSLIENKKLQQNVLGTLEETNILTVFNQDRKTIDTFQGFLPCRIETAVNCYRFINQLYCITKPSYYKDDQRKRLLLSTVTEEAKLFLMRSPGIPELYTFDELINVLKNRYISKNIFLRLKNEIRTLRPKPQEHVFLFGERIYELGECYKISMGGGYPPMHLFDDQKDTLLRHLPPRLMSYFRVQKAIHEECFETLVNMVDEAITCFKSLPRGPDGCGYVIASLKPSNLLTSQKNDKKLSRIRNIISNEKGHRYGNYAINSDDILVWTHNPRKDHKICLPKNIFKTIYLDFKQNLINAYATAAELLELLQLHCHGSGLKKFVNFVKMTI